MLCIRGTSHGPVSVAVTSRSSTKTAKQRITQTTPLDSPGTLVFYCQRSPPNSTGRQIQVGWVKIGDFRQITGYISKTAQDRRMISIKVERKSYVLYRMVTLPMTLSDPMSLERLVGLSVISIEHAIGRLVDTYELVDQFANLKARKVLF